MKGYRALQTASFSALGDSVEQLFISRTIRFDNKPHFKMSQPNQETRRLSASRAARPSLKRRGSSFISEKPEAKTRKVANLPPARQCTAYFSVHQPDGNPIEYAMYPKLECIKYMLPDKYSRTVPGYVFDVDAGNEQYLDFEFKIEEGNIQPDPGFVYRVAAVSTGGWLNGFGQFIKVPRQDCTISRSIELRVDTKYARRVEDVRRTKQARANAQEAAKQCHVRLRTMAVPVAPTTSRMVSSSFRQITVTKDRVSARPL
jgi:hypothetical protein